MPFCKIICFITKGYMSLWGVKLPFSLPLAHNKFLKYKMTKIGRKSKWVLNTSVKFPLSKNVCFSGHHPNQQIYVVMTSPFVDQKTGRLPSLTRNLTNLQIKYLNVDSFIQGTSLESLWQNDVIISSRHLVSHLSDVLRFLILSRFGGTYLDSDVIVLKPLPNFYNFVGRESWTHPFVGEWHFQNSRGG